MPRIAIDAMGAFAAVHESESVKVCGCRPMKVERRAPGPAWVSLPFWVTADPETGDYHDEPTVFF